MSRLFLTQDEINMLAEKTNMDCAYEIAKQFIIVNLPDIEKRTQRFRRKRLHIPFNEIMIGHNNGTYRFISKKVFHDYRLHIDAIRGPICDKLEDLISISIQNSIFLEDTNETIERQVNEVVDDYLFKICPQIWYSHTDWEQYDP